MILRKLNENLNEAEYLANIQKNREECIQYLLSHQNGNTSSFPDECPVEINPYIGEVELQNYDKYVIGTFPPVSYILDDERIASAGINLISGNGRPQIPYYHGNSIQMWKLFFPNEFFNFNINDDKARIEKRNEILGFLKSNEINYSDIIYSTKRQAYNPNDTSLKNIVIYTNLIKHIVENPKADRILFNTSSTFGTGGIKIHQNQVQNGVLGRVNVKNNPNSFDLFFRACQDSGLRIELKVEDAINNILLDWTEISAQNAAALNNQLKTKIIFKARIIVPTNNQLIGNSEQIIKEFYVLTPFSPSLAALNLNNSPIVSNWLIQNPDGHRNELLKLIYNKFISFNQEDKIFLMNLNIFY
jgi:hypothetical protein